MNACENGSTAVCVCLSRNLVRAQPAKTLMWVCLSQLGPAGALPEPGPGGISRRTATFLLTWPLISPAGFSVCQPGRRVDGGRGRAFSLFHFRIDCLSVSSRLSVCLPLSDSITGTSMFNVDAVDSMNPWSPVRCGARSAAPSDATTTTRKGRVSRDHAITNQSRESTSLPTRFADPESQYIHTFILVAGCSHARRSSCRATTITAAV